ncbi:MAG: signal peptidase II [Treponema sp.]|nr:signal peptidase II [Treponema sp.]
MNKITQKKCLPFILTFVCFFLDQLTKQLIVTYIPLFSIGASFGGDFLRIIHVANPGIAFSLGDSLPQATRSLLFSAVPLAVLILVIVVYFRSNDFTTFQRWCICGVLGGGFGNLFDRFFRAEGVVDFIDIKFYGLLGLARWPTFNVADMMVVICGGLLFLSFFITIKKIEGR